MRVSRSRLTFPSFAVEFSPRKMLTLDVVPERSLGCEQWEFVLGECDDGPPDPMPWTRGRNRAKPTTVVPAYRTDETSVSSVRYKVSDDRSTRRNAYCIAVYKAQHPQLAPQYTCRLLREQRRVDEPVLLFTSDYPFNDPLAFF